LYLREDELEAMALRGVGPCWSRYQGFICVRPCDHEPEEHEALGPDNAVCRWPWELGVLPERCRHRNPKVAGVVCVQCERYDAEQKRLRLRQRLFNRDLLGIVAVLLTTGAWYVLYHHIDLAAVLAKALR
jgi:hypothetical protein